MFLGAAVSVASAFQMKTPTTTNTFLSVRDDADTVVVDTSDETTFATETNNNSRRLFLLKSSGLLGFATLTLNPEQSNALASYSSNARNLERINSGDYSGGSVYDNNPKSEAGKKRRAMVGCKNPVAREEAASLLGLPDFSEKDCNSKVLGGGETEFMLQALRNLDCPTCPYGIKSER